MKRKTITNPLSKTVLKGCFLLFLALFSTAVTAQITVDVSNKSIKEILKEIETKSEYRFFYNEGLKGLDKIASLQVKDATIDKTMLILLENTEINYKFEKKNLIVLVAKIKTIQSLQKKITGLITDEKGDPIIGATIIETSTNKGTVTDINGQFSFETENTGQLRISYVGYDSQMVNLTGKSSLKITLTQASKALDEVVVVGYGKQSKRNVSGAISSINSDDITRSTSNSLAGALTGKVQGISTRATDSRPGRGVNLQIRNMGNPLYVIDGIPYGGNTGITVFGLTEGSGTDVFNSLALDDIESISILKDASAAIYGLRASNGVVLVTTKKGKKNDKVQVNFNGYYGVQNFARFPYPASAGQYVRGLVESEQNYNRDPSLLYSKDELAKWEAGVEPGYKGYNYRDIISRKDVPQNYINGNVSGGNEKSNYYISVSHLGQEAILKDFNYSRTNLQANLDATIAQGLTLGTQINTKLENTHNVSLPALDDYFHAFLSMFNMWPIESMYANDNPNYINQTHNISTNPAIFKENISGWLDNKVRATNVNLYAKYQFKFGLIAKATFSYNYENEDFDAHEYTFSSYKYNQATDSYETKAGWGVSNPWKEKHKRNVTSRYQQIQLSYDKQFSNHHISAVAAFERSDYENSYMVIQSKPQNNYIELMSFSELSLMLDQWNYEARAGYIGKFNYDYKGKYLIELLGRYDASYLYAPDKRWGFFPGISLGWRISDESFFSPLKKVFDDLKIRTSMGQTGSEIGVSQHGYLSGYDYLQGGSMLDGTMAIGLRPRGLPTTNLTWVTNTSSNIGIDMTLLNKTLTVTADIFQRKRTGLPAARYDVLLPIEAGYSLPNENLNSDEIVGSEGLITYANNIGKDFKYSIGLNATFSRFLILDNYKPRFENSWQEYRTSLEHRWAGVTWGYQVLGRFQSQDEINEYPVNVDGYGNRTLLPGDFKYKDINNDGVINSLDERPIGYARGAQPYFSYGINTGFEWKGVTLKMDFYGGMMQSFLRQYELKYPFQNNGNSPDYLLSDRWHRIDPYDPTSEWISGTYPATRIGNEAHSNYRDNDFWLINVKYLRLKNVEVAYNLPPKVLRSFGITNVRIYSNLSNLFSIDNVKQLDIDPEISAEAALVYPLQKTIVMGLNITF